MPTTDQLRAKLIEKLQELFQLDQPELDFGFYRIMHAKAEQVQRFLENDLLTEVQQAFADGNSGKQAELKAAYEALLSQAQGLGAAEPENAPMVLEAKARWEAALDTTKAEAEVYDHLYRFFERYYEDGDFVSRRYLTRETPGKAAPYAVPYDGQEVMLHWANRDQYYIKTSEHFSHYSFDAREAARLLREEAKKNKEQITIEVEEDLLQGGPLRVHFRIVEAAEGEHNNVKESADKKRYFIVDGTAPLAFTEAGELECRFTYRPDPEKTGQENTWKQTRNKRNEEALLGALTELAKTDPSPSSGQAPRAADYLKLLKLSAPRGAKKDERSLLGKYIEKYTATNSKDYFIHKDLGGFLRRELDFYLKNEVMRLDDLEQADAPRVEHYLAKLKVIRRIAHKLIDFLAQLENFQKKLWLKKKFVVETNWCITLDRVPEALYPAIAANPRIKAEWEKLFHIQDLPGYEANKPLTVDFLKANPYLVLDTAFLTEAEKAQLLAALDDLDAQCNGLLVHSENFQALRMLEGRYREQVQGVYIDPPYNTDAGPILYKNDYRSSSWTSMIAGVLGQTTDFMMDRGILCATIDDYQQKELHFLLEQQFGKYNQLGTVAVRINPSGRPLPAGFAQSHEYAIFCRKGGSTTIGKLKRSDAQMKRYKEKDLNGAYMWELFRKRGSNSERSARPSLYYPLYCTTNSIRVPAMEWNEGNRAWDVSEAPRMEEVVMWPIDDNGVERTWRWKPSEVTKDPSQFLFKLKSGTGIVYYKFRPDADGVLPTTVWLDAKYSATEHGTGTLKGLFKEYNVFSYPKSIYAVQDSLVLMDSEDYKGYFLDYFAGSGTTGHAIVEMNRQDGGDRKYVLVEVGSYFDAVTKPRMQKVVYSSTWKDGVPVNRDGTSHCFKYIRLESYEDTLNALELRTDAEREKLLAAHKGLREDYTLRYLLDVETQGSTSLLNHAAFVDPRAYTITTKKPGSEESTTKAVDLLESFNYLLGLRVQHIEAPETFTAAFERVQEKDVPKDSPQRLVVKGSLKPHSSPSPREKGPGDEGYWFRKVQGWMPRDRHKPHGEREKVLIIWRTLTDDREQDNAVLDTYFEKNRLEIRDREYDVIYVNGSNNLPNLLQAGERWKVRLIEEDFHRLMWEGVE